ncbi:MAG: caspase family protein [Bacteroidota bacterium]
MSATGNPDESVKAFDPRKNHLFIVGIDKYEHATNLENCVSDAEGFKDVLLEKYQFDETRVTTIYDGEATKEGIISGLMELSADLSPKDNLIIFFSGHGYYHKKRCGLFLRLGGRQSILVRTITEYFPNLYYVKSTLPLV